MKKEKKLKDEVSDVLPRVKNQANYNMFPEKFEESKSPSLTQPNQAMTVLEMIRRHQKGLPIDGNTAIPLFNGEDALPDISDLDLADQQEIIEAVADRLADIKFKISEENKSEQQKKEVSRIEALVAERLKEIQKANNQGNTTEEKPPK